MLCFGHVILASRQSAPFFWNTEFAVRASFLLHDSFDSSCFLYVCSWTGYVSFCFALRFHLPWVETESSSIIQECAWGYWLQVFSLWDYRVFEPCTFMEGGMNHGHNPSFWLFECACCLFLDLVFCHGLSLICKESCCARTISSKCFRCVLLALLFWYRQLADPWAEFYRNSSFVVFGCCLLIMTLNEITLIDTNWTLNVTNWH